MTDFEPRPQSPSGWAGLSTESKLLVGFGSVIVVLLVVIGIALLNGDDGPDDDDDEAVEEPQPTATSEAPSPTAAPEPTEPASTSEPATVTPESPPAEDGASGEELSQALQRWEANAGRPYFMATDQTTDALFGTYCVIGTAGDPGSVEDIGGLGAAGPVCAEGVSFLGEPQGVEALFDLALFALEGGGLVQFDADAGVPTRIDYRGSTQGEGDGFVDVTLLAFEWNDEPDGAGGSGEELSQALQRWEANAGRPYFMAIDQTTDALFGTYCVIGTAGDPDSLEDIGGLGVAGPVCAEGVSFLGEPQGVEALFDLATFALEGGGSVQFDADTGVPTRIDYRGSTQGEGDGFVDVTLLAFEWNDEP